MKRRDFIKLTSVAGAGGLVLESCKPAAKQAVPLLISEERFIPGVEAWRRGVCFQCTAGCGIMVKVINGDAKKIEGNPDHPLNRGKLCARGQAGLQVLYNPDRVRTPLRRKGPRGSGQWEPISWEEGLHQVHSRLSEIRNAPPGSGLVLVSPALRGQRRVLLQRFVEAFGPATWYEHDVFEERSLLEANFLTTGHRSYFAHDLEQTRYLLSFGATFLEASISPVRYGRGFGHLRQGRPGQRGKVVQIESRYSATAASADEWLPVAPGKEPLLALGLAHVLVAESLYDEEFVAGRTEGFGPFRRQVLEKYGPDSVAQETGIASERIQKLAREFAGRKPSLAIAGDSATAQLHGVAVAAAVNALNALVGSYGAPGGVFQDPDVVERRQPDLFDLRQQGEPVVLLYESNPAYSWPPAATMLERAGFVASISSFLDESSTLADIVLPASTYLERWVDDVPSPGVGISVVSVGKPVLRPLYDTRSPEDVLLALWRALGLRPAPVADSFEGWIKVSLESLFRSGKGKPQSEDLELFLDKVLEQGGWWDEQEPPRFEFRTPSRKFQFHPELLDSLPQAAPPSPEFALPLYIFRTVGLSDGRGANQPWLQELPEPMSTVMWNTWLELNPRTARELGLEEGDLVRIRSRTGSAEATVTLFAGAMPGVACMPAGQGHSHYGRYAQGRGANALALVDPQLDPRSGALAWGATRVTLEKTGSKKQLAKLSPWTGETERRA
ncbi:MAG: molybdopterin-dependent oxidoreductase [Acidobacteria bacterium]|nr:molybdopterin-dependent oxidoreductase [Acidobacteriota bacterium]